MLLREVFLSLFIFFLCTASQSFAVQLIIQSDSTVQTELLIYDGLEEISLFKGNISAGGEQDIQTGYHGLALLCFANGPRYPFIIGNESFTLRIVNPTVPPVFPGGGENVFLYQMLDGGAHNAKKYNFARLMIQAKQLLESSYSIKTIKELTAKKEDFHEFVSKHYKSLRHSYMVRRLLAQYFMMHEYIDYHVKGAPVTDIQVKYQQEVLNGVKRWMEVLEPYCQKHEVVNFCISLYYSRSMVTLASRIIEHFRDAAYCPGFKETKDYNFPDDLIITDSSGTRDRKLGTVKGKKTIAFVSDDCPASMVETVVKARQMVNNNKGEVLVVASLEQLSKNHLSLNRMIVNGNILFIKDERWRENIRTPKIGLPLFISIDENQREDF